MFKFLNNLFVILLFTYFPNIIFAQNANNIINSPYEPYTDPNLGLYLYCEVFEDTVVHIVWDELFYSGKAVNEIKIEKSFDGITFNQISQVFTNNLFDIHVNDYPEDIEYFNTPLYSTEVGSGRFIYNDVEKLSVLKYYKVYYRLLMITYDGFYLYTSIFNQNGEFYVNDNGELKVLENTLQTLKGGNDKPPCPSISTPTSGYSPTGQTQTLYGDCCYYTQVQYQSNNPVLSPCGGSSYSWCCNNVPGASSCPSGWTSDPCCVHTCSQYSSCACTKPWNQCCSASQVSEWVVTQSVTYNSFVISTNVVNETCTGMADGSVSITIAGGVSPFSINWSNGQNGTSINNLSAGNYSVTITDANNCTETASVTLSANPPPTASITTVDASCFGFSDGQITAVISNGTAPYTYAWYPSTIAGNVPVASSLSAGTYTLTVTDINTCQSVSQITITEPPLLTYNYTTIDLLCYGDSDGVIDITTSGGTAPYNYTWQPNVSVSNNATNLIAGNYLVTITDSHGCDTTASISINQPPQLILSTNNDFYACIDEPVTIGASAVGGVPPYVFNWDNGLGAGDSFNLIAVSTTTYNVTVTDANNCVDGPGTFTMTLYPPLSLNVTASPSAICDGESTNLIASGSGGNGGPYIYTWDNGIMSNAGTVNVSPNTTTTYNVTVADNCTTPITTASVVVTVFPSPIANFTADIFNGCQPLSVSFTDLSTPAIQSWVWDFGDPLSTFNNTSNQQNPSHVFNQHGTFSVSLSVTTADGCKDSYIYNNMITVYPKPIPVFTATPNPGSTINSTINFYDQSMFASSWNWNFGESVSPLNTSNIPSPMHTYMSAGSYVVTLVVVSDYGCIDSTTNVMNIIQDFMFWAPNAFTPNDNGINDIWRPQGVKIDPNEYELYIYDRWGKEVFSTRDINHGWDGAINGNQVAQGVYTWLVRLKELGGKKHIFNGRITLIK